MEKVILVLNNKKIIISLFIGISFSSFFLYLAFKNVPFDKVIKSLRSMNYWWLIPSFFLSYISTLFRAKKWQIIVNTSETKIKFWESFHPMMISFFVNFTMPARIGEVVRPYILYAKKKANFSTILATVVLERVFDLIALLVLFVLILGHISFDSSSVITFGNYVINAETLTNIVKGSSKLAIFLIISILFLSSKRAISLITTLSSKFKSYILQKIFGIVLNLTNKFSSGLVLIKSFPKIVLCFLYTFAAWIFIALSLYVLTFGFPNIHISFLETVAVFIIICFFISLPSAPGFWGLWEAGGVFALSLFAVKESDAATLTMVYHIVQASFTIFFGFISLMVSGLSFKDILQKKG